MNGTGHGGDHQRARYTHGHTEAVLRSHRWRTAENSAAYLLGELRAGMSVLDVGCGPGTLTVDLARRVAPGRVVAVDASDMALTEARAEADRQAVAIDFRVGDAEDLDFPDDAFDVVHAHQVLQHLGDPVRALCEMRRVTRPGGIVAVRESDYGAFAWWPALPELDAWMTLYQQVSRLNGGEPNAGRRLLQWAHAAGFADVTAGSSTWCFATEQDRAWWGGMWADRILTSDLAEQLVSAQLATRDDLTGISSAWQRWADDEDGWISILHGELICRV